MMKFYSVLPEVVHMSMMASIVVLAVLAARLLLRKAPKLFSYLLWGLVLFRLLCPVSVSSSLSVWKVFTQEQAQSGMRDIGQGAVYGNEQQEMMQEEGKTVETEPVLTDETSQAARVLSVKPVTAAASWVWLAGMAAIIGYSYVNFIHLRKRLVGAVPVKKDLSKPGSSQGKRGYGNIYETDCPAAPFVMGIIKPRIYLPLHLEDKEREYILLHERTHIRRLDHIFKLLGFLALVIHWFNPLIWLAFRLAEKDMEMSCDEAVMKAMEEDVRKEYSGSLLKLALNGNSPGKNRLFWKRAAGTPLAFGEGDVKERVKNVMKYKKPAILVSILSVAIIAVLAVMLGTNPNKEATAEDSASDGRLAQAEELADSWAQAFTKRDGGAISSLCTEEVKKEFFGGELAEAEGEAYLFGYSSPWP